jgi:hypothetical protein
MDTRKQAVLSRSKCHMHVFLKKYRIKVIVFKKYTIVT